MIIDQLREKMNSARKERNSTLAMILSTLIGEMMASAVVKDGEKVVTDKIAVATLKKARKNLQDNMEKGYGNIEAQAHEARIVEMFLPADPILMNEAQTREAIYHATVAGCSDVKTIMAYMKKNYEGQFDGKLTSSLAKEMTI